MSLNPQTRLDELYDLSNRCQLIIDNLENNSGWLLVQEDLQKEKQRLDDNWQYVKEDEQWIEWRATKMAVIKILNVLEDYKADRKATLEEIEKLEHPDKFMQKDYQET